MSIRVIIADDHPVFRLGITALLKQESDSGIVVVGEFADGDALLDLVHSLKPEVVLLDIFMPGFDALKQVPELTSIEGGPKVLILTAYEEDDYITKLIAAGVSGYLLKDEAPDMIVQAIQAVARGETWFSQRIAGRVLRSTYVPGMEAEMGGGPAALTPREKEILQLIARGKTNSDIAETLALSKATVQNYVSSIYAKLGVDTRSEAILYALRSQLVDVKEIIAEGS